MREREIPRGAIGGVMRNAPKNRRVARRFFITRATEDVAAASDSRVEDAENFLLPTYSASRLWNAAKVASL
jgi:hypothetical protein